MNNQKSSSGAELSAEEEQQKAELEKFLMSVKAQGQEQLSNADQALQTAEQAKRRAMAQESMTTSELLALEDRLNTAEESVAKSGGNMKQRLADEREARRKQQAGEK